MKKRKNESVPGQFIYLILGVHCFNKYGNDKRVIKNRLPDVPNYIVFESPIEDRVTKNQERYLCRIYLVVLNK